MKKALVLVFTALIALTMTVSAIAASDDFVSSPTGKEAPTVKAFLKSANCNAVLTITAYTYEERINLDEDARLMLEAAYDSIYAADQITDLTADLAEWIKGANESRVKGSPEITPDVLAISDLFDMSVSGCDVVDHLNHDDFTVTLESETFANFVSVLHYTKDGWETIEGAELNKDGTEITFRTKVFSPFAIVVHDGSVQLTERFPYEALVLIGSGAVLTCIGAGVMTSFAKKRLL